MTLSSSATKKQNREAYSTASTRLMPTLKLLPPSSEPVKIEYFDLVKHYYPFASQLQKPSRQTKKTTKHELEKTSALFANKLQKPDVSSTQKEKQKSCSHKKRFKQNLNASLFAVKVCEEKTPKKLCLDTLLDT